MKPDGREGIITLYPMEGAGKETPGPVIYHVTEVLGEGASSVSYAAHKENGMPGVLKEFLPKRYRTKANRVHIPEERRFEAGPDGREISDEAESAERFIQRMEDGNLAVQKDEGSPTYVEFTKRRTEFIHSHELLVRLKQSSRGETSWSKYVPFMEVFQSGGCGGYDGTAYVFMSEAPAVTFEKVCEEIREALKKTAGAEGYSREASVCSDMAAEELRFILGAMRELAAALKAFSDEGLRCTDVSPGNFGFTQNAGKGPLYERYDPSRLKVIDLGSVYRIADSPEAVEATLGYADPKIEDGKLPGNPEIIYSVGAVLFRAAVITLRTEKNPLYKEEYYDRLPLMVQDSKLIRALHADDTGALQEKVTDILRRCLCPAGGGSPASRATRGAEYPGSAAGTGEMSVREYGRDGFRERTIRRYETFDDLIRDLDDVLGCLNPPDASRGTATPSGGYSYVPQPAYNSPVHSLVKKPANPNSVFVGRKDELKKMEEELLQKNTHVIFLLGMGGIGKTQLAMQYAKLHEKKYDNVVVLKYRTGLRDMVIDRGELDIKGVERRTGETGEEPESEEDFYFRKMRELRDISSREKTLLIVDNYNTDNDPDYETFTQGNQYIIFTTRNENSSKKQVRVEAIGRKCDGTLDAKEILQVFQEYYIEACHGKGVLPDDYGEHVLELIEMFEGNTLLVQHLAYKIARDRNMNVGELHALVEEYRAHGLRRIGDISEEDETDRSTLISKILLEQARVVYDIKKEKLTDEERQVLWEMSLLDPDSISTDVYEKWSCLIPRITAAKGSPEYSQQIREREQKIEELNVTIDGLIDKNWLQWESRTTCSMHPLVRAAVLAQLKDREYYPFLDRIGEWAFWAWGRSLMEEKEKARPHILAILRGFGLGRQAVAGNPGSPDHPGSGERDGAEDPAVPRNKQLEKLLKEDDNFVLIFATLTDFLWQVYEYQEAIDCGKELYQTCRDCFGADSVHTGYCAWLLGMCYKNAYRGSEALPWYMVGIRAMEASLGLTGCDYGVEKSGGAGCRSGTEQEMYAVGPGARGHNNKSEADVSGIRSWTDEDAHRRGQGGIDELARAYGSAANAYTWEKQSNPDYRQDFEKALQYADISIRIRENLNDRLDRGEKPFFYVERWRPYTKTVGIWGIASAYQDRAWVYFFKGEWEYRHASDRGWSKALSNGENGVRRACPEAESDFRRAYEDADACERLMEETDDVSEVSKAAATGIRGECCFYLGILCKESGRFEEAYGEFRNAAEILEETTKIRERGIGSASNTTLDAKRCLMHAYEELGEDGKAEELRSQIDSAMKKYDPDVPLYMEPAGRHEGGRDVRPFLVNKAPVPIEEDMFIGRDDEMEAIEKELKKARVVFLCGMGGIGKSELARQYWRKHASEYENVVALEYKTSLPDMVTSGLEISGVERKTRENGEKPETQQEFYKRKMEALRTITSGHKTLLIVDNYNTDSDPYYDSFTEGNHDILFTTRNEPSATSGISRITVEAIGKKKDGTLDAKELLLFKTYYERAAGRFEIPKEDEENVRELIRIFEGNTLMIQHLAVQIALEGVSGARLNGLVESFQKKTLRQIGNIREESGTDRDSLIDDILLEQTRAVFDVSGLSDDKKQILREMSLMDISGISTDIYLQWSGLNPGSDIGEREKLIQKRGRRIRDLQDQINWLVQRNWLQRKSLTEYSMHMLVQAAVYDQLKPDAGNCAVFLDALAGWMVHAWSRPDGDNSRQTAHILSAARYFAGPGEGSGQDPETGDPVPFAEGDAHVWSQIPNFLWQVGRFEEAVYYGERLFKTCRARVAESMDAESRVAGSMDAGYCARILGECCRNRGKEKEALKWYEEARGFMEAALGLTDCDDGTEMPGGNDDPEWWYDSQGLPIHIDLSDGGENDDLAWCYERLAQGYSRTDPDKALRYAWRALRIRVNLERLLEREVDFSLAEGSRICYVQRWKPYTIDSARTGIAIIYEVIAEIRLEQGLSAENPQRTLTNRLCPGEVRNLSESRGVFLSLPNEKAREMYEKALRNANLAAEWMGTVTDGSVAPATRVYVKYGQGVCHYRLGMNLLEKETAGAAGTGVSGSGNRPDAGEAAGTAGAGMSGSENQANVEPAVVAAVGEMKRASTAREELVSAWHLLTDCIEVQKKSLGASSKTILDTKLALADTCAGLGRLAASSGPVKEDSAYAEGSAQEWFGQASELYREIETQLKEHYRDNNE